MAHSTAPNDDRAAARSRIDAPARPVAIGLLLSLRPAQWTKNLIVFAGLIFGQRLLGSARAIVRSAAAFAIFCALSGVVYLINDVADREADRPPSAEATSTDRVGRRCRSALAVGTAVVLGVGALAAALAAAAARSRWSPRRTSRCWRCTPGR